MPRYSRNPDKQPRRGPPNYFARSVQVRLLMMVFSFMLVLVLMNEARKPHNWAWMWAGAETQPAEVVDTRLVQETSDDPVGTVYASDQTEEVESLAISPAEQTLNVIRREVWSQATDRLDLKQQRLLYRLLRAARHYTQLAEPDRNGWASVFQIIDSERDRYLTERRAAVAEAGTAMPDSQRERLTQAFDDFEIEWEADTEVALRAVLDERGWTELERETLVDLEQLIDEIAFDEIRDDTVSRGVEQPAWFRMFEKLNAASLDELDSQSLGTVGFSQLFRQTAEYRGKLVTVRGTARWGYRVSAHDNDHGVDHYYVIWMRLDSDSPIVVYSLDLPPGFPEVTDRQSGEQVTMLEEDIEFTGYFFKRWAYRAQDGVRTAPQLLAKMPRWQPPVVTLPSEPSPALIVACALVIAMIAVSVARIAYSSTRRTVSGEVRDEFAAPTKEQFRELGDAELAPSTRDALQRLADEVKDESS